MVKFSGLTIFEFINHDKVTFFSARTSPNFSYFPRQVKHVRFLRFRVKERPKKYFLLSTWRRELRTRSSIFYYLIDTWDPPVCNSGQYIYVTGLRNFLFVQDLIDRINCYFQRIAFQRNLLLISFKYLHHKFFPMKISSLLKWRCINL